MSNTSAYSWIAVTPDEKSVVNSIGDHYTVMVWESEK